MNFELGMMEMFALSKTLIACLPNRLLDAVRSLHHMQLHITDCGFSVASYIIESLSGVEVLPEEIKHGNDAISLGAIKRLLADYCIQSAGIRNSKSRFDEKCLYILQKDGEHFICIEKTHSQYFIFDPVCGLYKESLENIQNYNLSEIMLKVVKVDCLMEKDKCHYCYREMSRRRAPVDLAIIKIKSFLG